MNQPETAGLPDPCVLIRPHDQGPATTGRETTIRIPVDLTNPGQFFACCGLLELADRLWAGTDGSPGAYGWFERGQFCLATEDRSRTLALLLEETRALAFEVGDDSEGNGEDDAGGEADLPVEPICLLWRGGKAAVQLDWWKDRSIKPWSGSMKERVILRAMLDAIDSSKAAPFNDLRRVLYYPRKSTKGGKPVKPEKKEPFYFDPRRGNKSHPLDCGFSPDTHKMEAECCPALEALCFIGLQRARPTPTGIANQSRYTVWPQLPTANRGLSANLVGAVTGGFLRFAGSTNYIFDNYFRTDRRQLKTFSQATLEGNTHD